jgi:hypothetical protein
MSSAVAEREMIVHDLSTDQYITLSRACRKLPKKPAPSTLWHWRVDGVKIKGRKIKLQCVRVGGQWYTTEAAFSEFLRQQTEAALAPPHGAGGGSYT